jgi:hypothetical protein
MEVNLTKSFVLFFGLNGNEMRGINQIMPFQVLEFNEDLKYLGFVLKANGYGSMD